MSEPEVLHSWQDRFRRYWRVVKWPHADQPKIDQLSHGDDWRHVGHEEEACELANLASTVKALREERVGPIWRALKRAEWAQSGEGTLFCPSCGRREEYGHTEDCLTAAVLRLVASPEGSFSPSVPAASTEEES